MRRITTLALLAGCCLAPGMVSAQTDSLGHLLPGTRVSVILRNLTVFYPATVVRSTDDRLEFDAHCRGCASNIVLPLSAIARIAVPAGRAHTRKAALIGGGIGLLAGTVISGIIIEQLEPCTGRCDADLVRLPVFSALGLVGGTVTGLVIGTRRWHQVWP